MSTILEIKIAHPKRRPVLRLPKLHGGARGSEKAYLTFGQEQSCKNRSLTPKKLTVTDRAIDGQTNQPTEG